MGYSTLTHHATLNPGSPLFPSWQAEVYDSMLFQAAINVTHALDDRFGLSRKRVMSQVGGWWRERRQRRQRRQGRQGRDGCAFCHPHPTSSFNLLHLLTPPPHPTLLFPTRPTASLPLTPTHSPPTPTHPPFRGTSLA
jgi:hypothetical protein